jgi:DNA repair protein RecN (Recombination protein N)
MLLTLHIKNYALIEDLRLEFSEGLNIFTGETGAGKSIIIESLGLILGERASAQAVRKGSGHCFISGQFDCSHLKALQKYLADQGLSGDGDLILRREIDAAGKSRAFVNDLPVGLATLHAIGEHLVDVHGQHEHQSLIKTTAQRHMLDRFGELEDLREEVGKSFALWRELSAQLQSQQMSAQERQRLIDLYAFQQKEIDAARLVPGEEEEIDQALPQLKNAGKLKILTDEAYQILYGTDGAVVERLSKVQRILDTVQGLGGTLAEPAETIKNTYYQIEEAARDIEHFSSNLRSDPARLNEYLDRRELINKLKRKYGQSITEVLSYREKIAAELSVLARSDENRQELERKAEQQKAMLLARCGTLSTKREKAADKLARGVEKELHDLGMKKARLSVSFTRETEPTSEGIDKIEFMFSANAGENLNPLKDIASGGEMSRAMLAIKTVLAAADDMPVLVFDEIDAGIGGPMGQIIGRKMQALSRHHQILCITHLPQIASFSNQHVRVEKETKTGRTITAVRTLAAKDKVEEIARMLSGSEITATARKHAEELITSTHKTP